MSRIHRKIAGLSLAGLLTLGVSLIRPTEAWATCYGLWYDYYDSPSLQQIVGSTIRCPGFPDQHDMDSEGHYTETPWYTTLQVVCPCSGGGGGGGGGPFHWDENG